MKLKFDPSLEFQRDAIDAVVGVFNGQPISQTDFEMSFTAGNGGLRRCRVTALRKVGVRQTLDFGSLLCL